MPATSALRIWLLGGFRVELDGEPVPDDAWRRNRARALVKLLALAPGHRLHREQLMDALWPELDAQAEGTNLRKAIHFARQALAPEQIRVRGESVALEAPELWVDVEAFDALARDGKLALARELYRGDLLPEDRFESWSEDPRERLRSRYHRLLMDLATQHEAAGDLEAAVDDLEALVASDPLYEDGYLALMRIHALAGARQLAVRRYRQLAARLREELGVEPGDAVRELHAAIAGGRFPVAPPDPAAAIATPAGLEGPTAAPRTQLEERKLVTVLWADAVGSSADPEIARRELGAWADVVRLVLEPTDSVAEAQADGSVVAVFGVPSVHEDDASRALQAGLEVARRAPLPTRVGVATGQVIAAIGTAPGPRTVAGEVVADAGRLRQAAEPGSVLATARTCRAAGDGFLTRSEPVEVGRAGLDPRRVLGVAPGGRGRRHVEPPLVGRDVERSAVLALFDETVRTARPRLVLVAGSAGIGKSRLTREVAAAVEERRPETRILRGRCLPGGRDAVYQPLGEILRDACGISLGDRAARAQAKLRAALGAMLGTLPPEDVEATTFALATTAGIRLAVNPLDSMPADAVAQRLALAWPRFATSCASAGPAVLLLEDLHWAGEELLAMVEHVVARSEGPLLVLATARPSLRDSHPAFGAAGDVSTVALGPLSDDDSRRLLDGLLGDEPMDGALRGQLLARAEGNPFYLEQLTLHVRRGGAGALPDTLQSLLAARLDALSVPERRVLQEAAVVGRVFWEAPLLQALEDDRLRARLAVLERSGFVVRRPASSLPGQAEYTFRHALLHDVAYESLPRGRRAHAHAAAGDWLEATAGERLDEVIHELAQHYAAAIGPGSVGLAWEDAEAREAVRRKAVEYALRAGEASRRAFTSDHALVHHQRALDWSVGPDERVRSLEALADDHASVYHGDLAAARYREAIASTVGVDRAGSGVRLRRKLAWLMANSPGAFSSSPDPADAERLVDEAIAAGPDDAERAWLMIVRGTTARLYRGSEPFGQGNSPDPMRIDERVAAVEQAQAAAGAMGREDIALAAAHALGLLYAIAGRYAETLELSRRLVASLRPQDPPMEHADALRRVAVHLIDIKAGFEEALELGRRSRSLTGDTNLHEVMHADYPILAALFQLGRWEELLPVLEEHAAAFRAEPARECQFVRDGPAIGAAALTLIGRHDEARELAALVGDPLKDRQGASAWQARLATLSGDPATARAISFDKALEGRNYGPQHAFALLEALAALEDWDAALAFLPAARGAIPGNAMLAPLIDRVEGQALLARGNVDAGAELVERAADGFRRLKAPLEELRAREVLAVVGGAGR